MKSGPNKDVSRDDDYYSKASSWAADVNGSLRASRARAYWVAGFVGVIAMLEAIALVALMPLKTIVPYTITVDRQTGYAELQRGVQLGPLSESEAIVQSFLAQYVIARETLDAVDLDDNYKKVGTWSQGTARADYIAMYDRQNPQSILHNATAETQITVTLKSIAVLDNQSALVRFSADRREGQGPASRMDWAAVVQYAFSGAPLRTEERLINPLGFQVTHYRRDAESAGALTVAPPAATAVSK